MQNNTFGQKFKCDFKKNSTPMYMLSVCAVQQRTKKWYLVLIVDGAGIRYLD